MTILLEYIPLVGEGKLALLSPWETDAMVKSFIVKEDTSQKNRYRFCRLEYFRGGVGWGGAGWGGAERKHAGDEENRRNRSDFSQSTSCTIRHPQLCHGKE